MGVPAFLAFHENRLYIIATQVAVTEYGNIQGVQHAHDLYMLTSVNLLLSL